MSYLPNIYYLKAKDKYLGAHLTQGVVFKDEISPLQWLEARGLPLEAFTVEKADLVFYPGKYDHL